MSTSSLKGHHLLTPDMMLMLGVVAFTLQLWWRRHQAWLEARAAQRLWVAQQAFLDQQASAYRGSHRRVASWALSVWPPAWLARRRAAVTVEDFAYKRFFAKIREDSPDLTFALLVRGESD